MIRRISRAGVSALFAPPGSHRHASALSTVTPEPSSYIFRNEANKQGRDDASRTFWLAPVKGAAPMDLKKSYAFERAADRKSRFHVRNRIRHDGVFSNLFPIHLPTGKEGLEKCPLYKYEMYVTRENSAGGKKNSKAKGTPPADGEAIKRVSPLRSWKAIRRSLTKRFAKLPPLVQLNHFIYTSSPLPAEALQVPKEYLDLGWRSCEVRLVEQTTFAELDPSEIQQLLNKIVFWCIQGTQHTKDVDNYCLVREKVGKIVSLSTGISSGGLRVYKGTSVNAIFVDSSEVENIDSKNFTPRASQPKAAPKDSLTSTELRDTPPGVTPPQGPPIHFTVDSFIRAFTYKEKKVESYKISDASGVYLASVWEPATPNVFKIGASYAATLVKIRDFPEKNNLRLFEFTNGELKPFSVGTPEKSSETPVAQKKNPTSEKESFPEEGENLLPGILCLKIDTKGTIASESSVWEEIKQHYGSGPYDEDTQRRIARSIQGTPVVVSHTMEQNVIRLVTFPNGEGDLVHTGTPQVPQTDRETEQKYGVTSPRLADTRIRALLPHLDPGQPFAVFPDYTTQPMQVLHCCFDPRMRAWQDTAISVLSLMPEKRMRLLAQFAGELQKGLHQWGLSLSTEPLKTRSLSLLPAPAKSLAAGLNRNVQLRHPLPNLHPTSLLIVGIAKDRLSDEEKNKVALTVQQMGQHFRTNMVVTVAEEGEAVRAMAEQLLTPGNAPKLRDPNSAVLIITMDKDLRATRWVVAEALSRGILPTVLKPVSSPKRAALLCGNIKRQLSTKFEVNPLRGVDIVKEVPVLKGKRVLVIGVDSCHTNVISTGAIVGILIAPERNHILPYFWRHDARGRETSNMAEHFGNLMIQAMALYGGLDEIVILQDGDVFSELNAIKERIAASLPRCGLTFMCLHKRTNIRFVHDNTKSTMHNKDLKMYNNVVKGIVIPAATPVGLDYEVVAPSFYLQTHESNMSTSRTVLYTVHHVSPTLEIGDIQLLVNAMCSILSPQATKLPMSTRCAHRLADIAERLLDAVPQLKCEMIPSPLKERLWFL
ncbi:Piwi domain containing protein, putative [Angomonas deanei]|uniref:Piwi domain containing protein, putative n=1 Tax=Angomonas deanei TaxID=59799 RepID=A0A7G2CPH4_9TRYP|nr:Piwi domain containing protein, putative [Angomonas deanei]